MKKYVILVDKNNKKIGIEEKIEAHKKALLHRAFSIFVFNSKGELLIQKRAKEKYHCPNIWANTACSHPRPDENYETAIHRRLVEEMGFDTELKPIFSFIYKAEFENGLTEYEHDTVFVGKYDKNPKINPKEVQDYKWISITELKNDIRKHPNKYAPWFKIALKRLSSKKIIKKI